MLSIQQQVAAAMLCLTLCAQAPTPERKTIRAAEPRRAALQLNVTAIEDKGSRYPTYFVRLDNRGVGCFPVLIDPTFLPRSSSVRPPIVIEARVIDGHREITAQPEFTFVESAATAEDFMLLGCNRSYGMFVDLAHGGWRVNLEKGDYEIRFQGALRVRTFLETRPKLLESVAKRFRMSKERILEISADQALTSTAMPLPVRGK